MRTVDLFGGPGGWDCAAESLGLRPIGVEKDEWACATRRAAGLLTIRADVTTLDPSSFGDVEGLIASPPCTDFSAAGNRAGIDGETGRLMHEVPRWVAALRPTWIACEQVPPVLEWWEIFARGFRELGYRTWTGILCAADYGTPQTRTRAFLLARRDRPVLPPEPTHAKHPQPDLFGNAPARWVSMAEALGPDGDGEIATDLPAPTVCGARKPAWLPRVLSTGRDWRPDGSSQAVPVENPAPAVTSKSGGQWGFHRPATTVMGDSRIWPPGHHANANEPGVSRNEGALKLTIPELGVLQDFPIDYPWKGNKSQQSAQVGTAVPVRLARAVLEAVAK